jgi:type IV pilus assembly protein PilQ
VAIAKLGQGTLLDLELSALEREGRARIVSDPELITSNRQPALIESGQEIPYQEKTSSGATSVAFKKAVLSLKVTPEITPENRILLNLTVNQDKVDTLSVNGVPAISTQQVQSQVLLNDGETIVLGGIYEQINSNVTERIPFWSAIPVLGKLFTDKQTRSERKELLIFVTPKLVAS